MKRHALADRRVEDPAASSSSCRRAGRPCAPTTPSSPAPARASCLAQPAVGAFGAVSVAVRPRQMDDLDAHLDELLQDRLPRVPSQKEGARRDVQLGKGNGRLVRTTWEDGLVPMQGALVAWADGYDLFSLEAWAPAASGDAFVAETDALVRGIAPRGTNAARIEEGVERVAVQVPELSRDALRLLVAERMSEGRGLEDVPSAALRMVSRGLDALGAAEAAEMRTIYQQVWAPVPEAQRVRLAVPHERDQGGPAGRRARTSSACATRSRRASWPCRRSSGRGSRSSRAAPCASRCCCHDPGDPRRPLRSRREVARAVRGPRHPLPREPAQGGAARPDRGLLAVAARPLHPRRHAGGPAPAGAARGARDLPLPHPRGGRGRPRRAAVVQAPPPLLLAVLPGGGVPPEPLAARLLRRLRDRPRPRLARVPRLPAERGAVLPRRRPSASRPGSSSPRPRSSSSSPSSCATSSR